MAIHIVTRKEVYLTQTECALYQHGEEVKIGSLLPLAILAKQQDGMVIDPATGEILFEVEGGEVTWDILRIKEEV